MTIAFSTTVRADDGSIASLTVVQEEPGPGWVRKIVECTIDRDDLEKLALILGSDPDLRRLVNRKLTASELRRFAAVLSPTVRTG